VNAIPDTLIVAPYVGEFGWELMNWQGRVRWLAANGAYQWVVICAETDRRPLYVQPESKGQVVFCPVPRVAAPGHRNEDHRVDDEGRAIDPDRLRWIVKTQALEACRRLEVRAGDAELLMPDYGSTIWPTTPSHQLFVSLRVRQSSTIDVVLVPRLRRLGLERNRPMSWWEEAAERLRSCGLSVEMYRPRLDEAVRQLSRARLAVGASTGGLHLASLCGCPHYVWGSGAEARWTSLGITNRQRYETVWNPLGTACRYDECGWQPAMGYVVDQTRRALDDVGLAPGCQSSPAWSLKPKWRIKRHLARLLGPGRADCLWPWRIRNLVRERIV
jgi:hypothetical protein